MQKKTNIYSQKAFILFIFKCGLFWKKMQTETTKKSGNPKTDHNFSKVKPKINFIWPTNAMETQLITWLLTTLLSFNSYFK